MIYSRIRKFSRDESGVGTMWALAWLVLVFGIGGMAVDITSALRTQTMLQATADAAALAGTIVLPKNDDEEEVESVIASVNMAFKNMNQPEHGTVLVPGEVAIGDWDHDARTLIAKQGEYPTAVLVTTRRDDTNENPLSLSYLRILSLTGLGDFDRWNVYAQAAAERFIPDCLSRTGMVARGVVDIRSNNTFRGDLCIHSQDHVEVQQHNRYYDEVTVSMPDKNDLAIPDGDFQHNGDLEQRLASLRLDPKMVDHIDNLIATFMNPALDDEDLRTNVIPSYITNTNVITMTAQQWKANKDLSQNGARSGWNFHQPSLFSTGMGRIVFIDCANENSSNKQITIGNNSNSSTNQLNITDMAIISDCRVNIQPYTNFANVVLASSGGNGQIQSDNIILTGNSGSNTLGRPDNCANGGGMLILSTQSIGGSAQVKMNGVQAVVRGNISLAAQAQGVEGVHLQAGGEISITSNSEFGGWGLCQGGVQPLLTADYFRLVY